MNRERSGACRQERQAVLPASKGIFYEPHTSPFFFLKAAICLRLRAVASISRQKVRNGGGDVQRGGTASDGDHGECV